jgi:hypothetical protein
MQRLEVSCAVRHIYMSLVGLGLKRSKDFAAIHTHTLSCVDCYIHNYCSAIVSLVCYIFIAVDHLFLIISVMNLDIMSTLNKE